MKKLLAKIAFICFVIFATNCAKPPTTPVAPQAITGYITIAVKCNGYWSGSNWDSFYSYTTYSASNTNDNVISWFDNSPSTHFGAAFKFTSGSFIQIDILHIMTYSDETRSTNLLKTVATNVNGDYASVVLLKSEL